MRVTEIFNKAVRGITV